MMFCALFTFYNISMPKKSKTENSGIHSQEDIDDNPVPSLKFNPFLDIELKPFEIFSNISLANEMPSKIIPVDEICNYLRIPDVVTQIKPFEGDSRTLSNFVSEVDSIFELINSQADPAYVRLILGKIRNKIIGEADRVLNLYRTPLDWPTIKTNLISHYADKRNEEPLMSTLYTLFQDDKTVEQFYSEIIDIYTILSKILKTNTSNDLIIEEMLKRYTNTCLTIFLRGLNEPLGNIVRRRHPSSLIDAYKACIDEQNMYSDS